MAHLPWVMREGHAGPASGFTVPPGASAAKHPVTLTGAVPSRATFVEEDCQWTYAEVGPVTSYDALRTALAL
jgi:hypothetical protein